MLAAALGAAVFHFFECNSLYYQSMDTLASMFSCISCCSPSAQHINYWHLWHMFFCFLAPCAPGVHAQQHLACDDFSARPPINPSFASTPLLHLLVFRTQTCWIYLKCDVCSLSTPGSNQLVQNPFHNDTFLSGNIFRPFSISFNIVHALPPPSHYHKHIIHYPISALSTNLNSTQFHEVLMKHWSAQWSV